MTGTEEVPPLGMLEKIEAVFVKENQPFFFAETCMFELKVPTVHEVLQDFKAAFMEACANNEGFGSI